MSYDPITGVWVDDDKNTPNEKNETSNFENKTENNESAYKNASPTMQGVYQNNAPKFTQKKKRSFGRAIALALVFGLVAGLTFSAANYSFDRIGGGSGRSSKVGTVETVESNDHQKSTSSVVSVAKASMSSIVSITNLGLQEVQSFFGGSTLQETESRGSGIIVAKSDTELLVVTNNHVVNNAETLTISFVNEESVKGKIKGTDSDNDLAVVAIDLKDINDETLDAIKIATIGDSDSMEIGEEVIAIGNALGYGQSVTSGIISAKDRTLENSGITAKLLQTDAAINPGNSGGALLNDAGELIGINVAKESATEVEAMGYAIPTSVAKPIIDNLMNNKTRDKVDKDKRGTLGVKCSDVNQQAAQIYGMPVGVYVSEVTSGSAAKKAGIEKGDIITKFDGSSISTSQALVNKLQYYEKGEEVKVTVQRVGNKGEYSEKEFTVKLS